ncbi:pyridoxamine 5'-phosphate oxidase family protein [Egibacter rhizosphaerae]|uniref:pyridoxamine 5'-phosphate oxidase family protein n=1 Tax=Egibacter rhizosphaerae TaxID=1670831 RepID=UPI0013F14ADA|nr:pyridoxamine 5'-phosphate oxidase family protein [Egibacter rhizosphaerae]
MRVPSKALGESSRCVLALNGRRGPVLAPMTYWSDGAHLWLTTAASSTKAALLRRSPQCQVYVAPPEVGAPGVVARGEARVFGLDDPVGLALHGPAIGGALAALGARNLPGVLGYARDLPRVPKAWRPRARVVLRVRLGDAKLVTPPALDAGVAPALPSVVPADVRRALAGERRVALGLGEDRGLAIAPATWSATDHGIAIDSPLLDAAAATGRRACVAVHAEPGSGPLGVAGSALHGELAQGVLTPQRVTWWRGFSAETVGVPSRQPGGIELPD